MMQEKTCAQNLKKPS